MVAPFKNGGLVDHYRRAPDLKADGFSSRRVRVQRFSSHKSKKIGFEGPGKQKLGLNQIFQDGRSDPIGK
jgi:hypothetical protein